MSEAVERVRKLKGRGRLVAITVVDALSAQWCAASGIDVALVGDSLGMVCHGLADTTGVTLEMIELATAAAARGLATTAAAAAPLLVGDMPLVAMRDPEASAERLIRAGAQAVKVECHGAGMAALKRLRARGCEVMAHVGLLPQEVERLGGYGLQGRTSEAAAAIIATAEEAEAAGAFSCVVEKVPSHVAAELTRRLAIPVIGIGAGPECDGQILVLYDLLGFFRAFKPKFVRRYAELGRAAEEALRQYAEDVRQGRFPAAGESYKG